MTRLRSQSGVTMVEVVMAVLILAIGSLAVLAAIDTGARGSYKAEQSQIAVSRAQAEMERIKSLPYSEVALTGTPSAGQQPDDPASRVAGTSYGLDRAGTTLRPLVYNGSALVAGGTVAGGTLSPTPTAFTSGDVSGTIYRYVVWVNDARCPDSLCPGAQDLKRVIVAVRLDDNAAGGDRGYQEIQADIVDPATTPVNDPVPPGGGEEGTFATFWLTDTTCNHAERRPLTGDHLTHNTLGACASGLLTGLTGGAPDLMYVEQPALDPNYPDDQQPLYDYATDVEPAQNPSSDRGLQVRKPTLDGCIFGPTILNGVPQQKIHRWVSQPVPGGPSLLLDGEATLSLWTRTIGAATHPGKICVWLFARKLNVLGVPVDTPMVNVAIPNLTWFEHSEASWPTGNWTELTVDMDFLYAAPSLLPGERLGLAIAVERAGTNGGTGLEFMYDHPSFDSRLQVKTSSTLPIFN